MDSDNGSSVTLIYYRIGDDWTKEPFLNVVAAMAQSSRLTHVEIAIGEDVGTNGMMTNVCRIFSAPRPPLRCAACSRCAQSLQTTRWAPSSSSARGATPRTCTSRWAAARRRWPRCSACARGRAV